MKLKINQNEIPSNYIGKLPKFMLLETFKDGSQIFEYEVNDCFIRDLTLHLSGAEQDNYTTLLIHLMFKADNINMFRLSEGYAAECFTIAMYKSIPDFYKQIIP
jgi:hypothetical protein